MIELKGLSVVYPDKTRAVDQVDLLIRPGENVALIGGNGAGKTSLIMAIMGIVAAQGDILVDGTRLDQRTLSDIRTRIGVVFQNPDDQLFMPTIDADIAFGLRNMGMDETAIGPCIERCLSRLDILHLHGRTALKLSGGEKRMAALATVLVMEPSTMIFDEPTAFLDHRARRKLIQILNGLGQTKLIATHDLTFAVETCQRAIVLKNGRIFADGPVSELLYSDKLMESCGMEAIRHDFGGSR